MRFVHKQRAVAALILAIAIWPAIQHVVMLRIGGNPWHFFGMAMYCVPHELAGLSFGQVRDGTIQGIPPENVTPELEAALERYGLLYLAVGSLAPLENLDDEMARAAPDAEALVLKPSNLVLDLETGQLEARARTFVFEVP